MNVTVYEQQVALTFLKILMEDNKLNFNRPLLSVRRFSSTVTSQKEYSKRKNGSSLPTISPSSSYKSGSMRNAGTVPFVWEHSPGNPKHESKTQKHTKNLIPNLPPGRILKPKKQSPQSAFPLEVKFTEFDNSKEKKKEPSHSQLPQNLPRKQLEVKKVVVNRENERPQITYGPNFLQFTGDDGEEDSDFDDNEHVNTSYKVCGLLPHFCLKGSIGLLNPLPGLSVRTRLPVSSANKTPPGSSSSSSTSSQPARVAVYEHRSLANQQKEQTTLKNESTEATNQKKSQNLERSGPSDHLQDHMDSNNATIDSENKEVNLQKKGLISFKELLAVENEDEASLQNHMVEKTLYVDTVHKVETPKTCENNKGIFGISHITNEPKQDNGMITEMEFCEDPKVDQDLKVSRQSELELPAPPPLPKSPSDSWLWRTLPSVSSKAPSSRSRAKPEKFELRNTQGQLLPIPEI